MDLDWIVEQKCNLLISPEGLVIEKAVVEESLPHDKLLEKKEMVRDVLAKVSGESVDGEDSGAIDTESMNLGSIRKPAGLTSASMEEMQQK